MRGLDQPDVVRVVDKISDWSMWFPAWDDLGNEKLAAAEALQSRGWSRSAGEIFLQAGLAFHLAKIYAVRDEPFYRELTLKSIDAVDRGLPLVSAKYEKLVVPFSGHSITANLRFPWGTERPPLVIIVPGTESVKEEFPRWEQVYLDRGMATLTVNGPGQGETGFDLRIRADYETVAGALIDAVEGRDDLDATRIGMVGMSVGGYYATRAAAFEKRITALIQNGTPFSIGACWERGDLSPLYEQKIGWNLGATSPEEGLRLAHTLDLAPVIELVDQPTLSIFGDKDALLREETDLVPFLRSSKDEVFRFPDGNHGVTNHPSDHLGPGADWMKEKLLSTP
jgi:2,6-dihydroxypseudooxynicotine hydrolase